MRPQSFFGLILRHRAPGHAASGHWHPALGTQHRAWGPEVGGTAHLILTRLR